MKTILINTVLMIGISFIMGFIVAGLIKLITEMLYFSQDHSVKDALGILKVKYNKRLISYTKIKKVSEKVQNELFYDLFSYSQSYNKKDKKEDQLPEIFSYSQSRNKVNKIKGSQLPEIFDYFISPNKRKEVTEKFIN